MCLTDRLTGCLQNAIGYESLLYNSASEAASDLVVHILHLVVWWGGSTNEDSATIDSMSRCCVFSTNCCETWVDSTTHTAAKRSVLLLPRWRGIEKHQGMWFASFTCFFIGVSDSPSPSESILWRM